MFNQLKERRNMRHNSISFISDLSIRELYSLMQQASELNFSELPKLLIQTFTSSPNNVIARAEQLLKRMKCEQPQPMFKALCQIINSPQVFQDKIIFSACIHLKNLLSEITQRILPENTPFYLQCMYKLITKEEGLSARERMFIATGIQHILDKDSLSLYKQKVLSQTAIDLPRVSHPSSLCGLLLIYQAFTDTSMQIQQIVNIFSSSFPTLKAICAKNLLILKSQTEDTIKSKQFEPFFEMLVALFEYFEKTMTKLMDEYSETSAEVEAFRADLQFIEILSEYVSFGVDSNRSAVMRIGGRSIEKVNQIKATVLRFEFVAYEDTPIKILELCISTFLAEAGQQFQNYAEQIMISVMNQIEVQIKRPKYYQYFSIFALEMISKGALYLRSSIDQIEQSQDDPQKYVEQLQDSVISFNRRVPKTIACSLLQTICRVVDGTVNFAVSISHLLLQSKNQDPEGSAIIDKMKVYKVFNASPEVQIDIGLHLLAIIQPIVKEREEAYRTLRILLSQYAYTLEAEQAQFNFDILAAKYMLVLGLYDIPMCINWITEQMKQSDIKKHMGLSTVNRMMKKKIEPKIVKDQFLKCLSTILSVAKPTDYMFETLVLDNYSDMLLGAPLLLKQCLIMMIKWMASSTDMPDEQLDPGPSLAVFNLFEGVIEREEEMLRVQMYQREFASYVALKPLKNIVFKDNIVNIMGLFLKKTNILSEYQRKFAATVFLSPFIKNINSCVLLYLNKMIAFEKFPENLKSVVDTFGQLLSEFARQQSLLSQVAILLSQAIACTCYSTPSITKTVLTIFPSTIFNSTRFRLLQIILVMLHSCPNPVQLLRQDYPTLMNYPMLKYFRSFTPLKLDRKILVQGIGKIIDIELSQNRNVKPIVMEVARILKEHSDEVAVKKSKRKEERRKVRKVQCEPGRVVVEEEERSQQQDEESKEREEEQEQGRFTVEVVGRRVTDLQVGILVKYLHPFDQVDEYQVFAKKLIEIKNHIMPQCDKNQKDLLKQLVVTRQDQLGRTRIQIRVAQ